jgi:hypothetical protein
MARQVQLPVWHKLSQLDLIELTVVVLLHWLRLWLAGSIRKKLKLK